MSESDNPAAASQSMSRDHDGKSPESPATEFRGVYWAAAWLGMLLFAYYLVRPVREMMSVKAESRLESLFLITFLVTAAAVPVYSYLVAKLRRQVLVPIVYRFFALCLLGFWLAMTSDNPRVQHFTTTSFFVWVTVFALFNTSVFWSVVTDLFSNQQGKRFFGIIASGGTAGAMAGSLAASLLAKPLGAYLVLVPIAFLEIGVWISVGLQRSVDRNSSSPTLTANDAATQHAQHLHQGDRAGTGGGALAGVVHAFSSPYLLLICLFLFFVQVCSTHIYFQQAGIVKAAVEDEAERTQLFARMNLGVQLLTLFFQTVVAGPLMRRLGLRFALCTLPVFYGAAFIGLATAPVLVTLVVVDLIVRSLGYGIGVPAREVLFTVVSREDKYKSKNVIDTLVLRGSDSFAGVFFKWLQRAGASSAIQNYVMLPVVFVWATVGWTLGRAQAKRAAQAPRSESDAN